MKNVFLVVGHSNWGKSETLKKLTSNNRRLKYFMIDGKWYFIKRMSNDDDETGLIEFIDKKAKSIKHDLIIAFCPEFEKPRKSKTILDKLSKRYNLNCFVIRYSYYGNSKVSDAEIRVLKDYGRVIVFESKSEAHVRAKALEGFIISG
jgi:hypothetical protein